MQVLLHVCSTNYRDIIRDAMLVQFLTSSTARGSSGTDVKEEERPLVRQPFFSIKLNE